MTSNARGTTVAEEYLTIPEVVAELRIPRSTFYYWRQLGRGPKALKLPNGDVRIRVVIWIPGCATWRNV
jgi:predicted DNA-binding transcriptional regulator AlpA